MAPYTKQFLISSTRFSEVYRAQDAAGNTVALKVTTPDEDRPPHSSRRELQLLQQISNSGSPHLLHLIDTFDRDLDEQVMVFPFYPLTLTSLLRHYAKATGGFNPYAIGGWPMSRDSSDGTPTQSMKKTWKSHLKLEQGLAIVRGLAAGLSYLHENGIIHRDIKPNNIMFKSYDPTTPVIIDLGISFKYPDNFGKENPKKKICDIATSVYKAPELLFGITDYSFGVDIWALGIVMTLIFSDDLKPFFDEEDVVDLKLISMIFSTFGTPTLEVWPEAHKSSTFTHWQPTILPPKPLCDVLPRASEQVENVFKKMMVYESSQRLSASAIHEELKDTSQEKMVT